jgi:aspartate/glutamate racemase
MAKEGLGLNIITIIMGMGFLLTAVYYRWYRKWYG